MGRNVIFVLSAFGPLMAQAVGPAGLVLHEPPFEGDEGILVQERHHEALPLPHRLPFGMP